jgi:hypothetical protein
MHQMIYNIARIPQDKINYMNYKSFAAIISLVILAPGDEGNSSLLNI